MNKILFLRNFLNINYRNSSLSRLLSTSGPFQNIIKSPAPHLEFPKGNLLKVLFNDVNKWSNEIALECSETNFKYSYSEVLEQTARWRWYLKQSGVSKGDVISIVAPNSLQFAPIFFGAIGIGAAISSINAQYNPDEIERMLKINKSKLVIFSNDVEPKVAQALKANIKNYKLFSLGKPKELEAQNVDDILYNEKGPQMTELEELDGNEIMFIPFSSGTTGLPKAVTLSHNAFLANSFQCTNSYHQMVRDPSGDTRETQMALLPFSHIIGCFSITTLGFFTGAKIIIVPKFDPKNYIPNIIKYKITNLHTVPSLLTLLNNSPDCNSETMGTVKTLRCGAAPVHPSSVDIFRKKVGKETHFIQGFGMSELLIATATPRRFQYPIGCGSLLSNVEAKIVHIDTGEVLGHNETGELCLRTPSVMEGYLDNPTATNEILREGWIHTGDISYYDKDEFFHIVDRTKDLIKVQGLQVSPSEIEDELQKHPSVAECSVIGIPDERRGEVPLAFVVLKDEATERDIQLFIEKRLSKSKHLRGGVKFIESLPKSQAGKVLRKTLRTLV